MSSTPEPSVTENTHRMVNHPTTAALVPCKVCHQPAVIEYLPDHVHHWKAYCPDYKDGNHRGINGQSLTAKSENACVGFWNRRQLGATACMFKPHVTDAQESRQPRVRCLLCGLTEPHECLSGEGFMRTSDYGDSNARVRMAGRR